MRPAAHDTDGRYAFNIPLLVKVPDGHCSCKSKSLLLVFEYVRSTVWVINKPCRLALLHYTAVFVARYQHDKFGNL